MIIYSILLFIFAFMLGLLVFFLSTVVVIYAFLTKLEDKAKETKERNTKAASKDKLHQHSDEKVSGLK